MTNLSLTILAAYPGFCHLRANANPAIQYIYPVEGTNILAVQFVIRHARPVDNAYRFIDYLSRPEWPPVVQKWETSTANQAAGLYWTKKCATTKLFILRKSLPRLSFHKRSATDEAYEPYWEKLRLRPIRTWLIEIAIQQAGS